MKYWSWGSHWKNFHLQQWFQDVASQDFRILQGFVDTKSVKKHNQKQPTKQSNKQINHTTKKKCPPTTKPQLTNQPKSTEIKTPNQTYCKWKFCLSISKCLWVKIFWPDGFFSKLRLIKEEYNKLLVSQKKKKKVLLESNSDYVVEGQPFPMNYFRTLGQLDCLDRCPSEIPKNIKWK